MLKRFTQGDLLRKEQIYSRDERFTQEMKDETEMKERRILPTKKAQMAEWYGASVS